LSYAKVRALTRVATPETEERLLAVGRAGTADHVERIVRGWRRVDRKAEARDDTRRHASRALHVYRGEDGMVIVRGRLAPEVGAGRASAAAWYCGTACAGVSWGALPGPARSLRRYGGRSITETAAAASRAAGSGSGRDITSVTGHKGAPPRSRISPCSVAGTT